MLEIRVPISPKPYFFRQVECLYRFAQACGGLTGNVRMVVSVGEDIEPYEIAATQPWSDANVIWRWAPREEFRELSYHAAVLDRFRVQSDAPAIPATSLVPAAVPLVIHNPDAPPVSMPRNSTSSPKTVKPGVTVVLKKPDEFAPAIGVSATVPLALPSEVHKWKGPISPGPLRPAKST
jgi:hypothetical protein